MTHADVGDADVDRCVDAFREIAAGRLKRGAPAAVRRRGASRRPRSRPGAPAGSAPTWTVERAGPVVAEPGGVGAVHLGERAHVGQEDGRLHDVAEAAAGPREDRREVVEDAVRLLGDRPGHELHRGRVERDLPGGEEEPSGRDPLRVGADGFRGVVDGDGAKLAHLLGSHMAT